MHTIGVAIRSETFCKAIVDRADGQLAVRTCNNGNQVLQLFNEIKPDLLVLDMELPERDGLSLLCAIRDNGFKMPILILTACSQSDCLQQMVARFDVAGIFLKPCSAAAVMKSVYEILAYIDDQPIDLEYGIRTLLLGLKIDEGMGGYPYLVEAIKLYYADPAQQITKVTYPKLGELFSTSHMQVERALRKCICEAWKKRDDKLWQTYFDAEKINDSPPTNKAFVLKMAECLKNMKIGQ